VICGHLVDLLGYFSAPARRGRIPGMMAPSVMTQTDDSVIRSWPDLTLIFTHKSALDNQPACR
jgi:hypothetical protein